MRVGKKEKLTISSTSSPGVISMLWTINLLLFLGSLYNVTGSEHGLLAIFGWALTRARHTLNNDTLAGFHLRHFRVTTRALWGDVLVSALSRKVAAIRTEGMVVNILKVTGSAFGLVTTKGRVTAFCVFPKKARNPVVQSQYLLMLEGQWMENA
jgi:hypothetical protein